MQSSTVVKRSECRPINIYAYTIPRKYCNFFTFSGESYAELSEHNRRGKLNEDNLAIYDITLGTYCPQEIQVEEDRYLRINQQNIFEYTLINKKL